MERSAGVAVYAAIQRDLRARQRRVVGDAERSLSASEEAGGEEFRRSAVRRLRCLGRGVVAVCASA
jgi:hypothetical protein